MNSPYESTPAIIIILKALICASIFRGLRVDNLREGLSQAKSKAFVKFIPEQHSFRRFLNHFRLFDEEFPKNFQLKLSSSAKNYGFSIFSSVLGRKTFLLIFILCFTRQRSFSSSHFEFLSVHFVRHSRALKSRLTTKIINENISTCSSLDFFCWNIASFWSCELSVSLQKKSSRGWKSFRFTSRGVKLFCWHSTFIFSVFGVC